MFTMAIVTSEMITIGGCRLAVTRRGEGSPSIVFVSGVGEPGTAWSSVLDYLATQTLILTYDRAGIEQSDPLPEAFRDEPQPVGWLADQLSSLLEQADVPPPYLLVGHSLGGGIIDAFAVRWPTKVAGLVFVDSADFGLKIGAHEPEDERVDGTEPGGLPVSWLLSWREFVTTPPAQEAAIPSVVIGSAPWRWLREDLRSAIQTHYAPLTAIELDQRWQRFQLELTKRWKGHLVVAHEAGHRIHDEAPQLVAVVIDAVVDAIRKKQPIALEQGALAAAGGTARVSYTPETGLTAWAP